jgi:hypothetical protein
MTKSHLAKSRQRLNFKISEVTLGRRNCKWNCAFDNESANGKEVDDCNVNDDEDNDGNAIENHDDSNSDV